MTSLAEDREAVLLAETLGYSEAWIGGQTAAPVGYERKRANGGLAAPHNPGTRFQM